MLRNLLRRLTTGPDASDPPREEQPRREAQEFAGDEADPWIEGPRTRLDPSFDPVPRSKSRPASDPDLDDDMVIGSMEPDDGEPIETAEASRFETPSSIIAAAAEPDDASEPAPEPRPVLPSCLLGWLDADHGPRDRRIAKAWDQLLKQLAETAREERPDLQDLDVALISGSGRAGVAPRSWLRRPNETNRWTRLGDLQGDAEAESDDAANSGADVADRLVHPPSPDPALEAVAVAGENRAGVASGAYRIVRDWIAAHPEAWPPVVAISGSPSALESRSLRALRTRQGPCKVYAWPAALTSNSSAGASGTVAEPRRGASRRTVLKALGVSPRPMNMTSVPLIHVTALRTAKRETPFEKREDADAFDVDRGRFAVADGAGGGIFVRLWAQMLADGFVAESVDLGETESRDAWFAAARKDWNQTVRSKPLNWAQQVKLQDYGAGATLLALEVRSAPPRDGAIPSAVWQAWGVGDACLWIVRGDQLAVSFPIIEADEFGIAPELLLSRAQTSRVPLEARGKLRPGDMIVLATDAVAQWQLRVREREGRFNLAQFIGMSPEEFQKRVDDARLKGDMPDDDCTLIILHSLFQTEPNVAPEIAAETETEVVEKTEPTAEAATATAVPDDLPAPVETALAPAQPQAETPLESEPEPEMETTAKTEPEPNAEPDLEPEIEAGETGTWIPVGWEPQPELEPKPNDREQAE